MINPVELVKKLISFPSVTPNDFGAIDYIENILKESGFVTYIKEFGPDSNPKHTKNLYAIYNSQEKNYDIRDPQGEFHDTHTICFAGHIDVVPPGGNWSNDPFTATEKNGVIYGRGAVDMKGALGAMIAAAINFIEQNPNKRNLAFLITSDEEGEGNYGTKLMLEWMNRNGHKIDFAIVGEPTCSNTLGDTIKVGRRGSLNFSLKIYGKQGHVAYPSLAKNPNHTMVKILKDLISCKLDDGNKAFDPSNLEVVSIDTNNKVTNLIPSEVKAQFNIRFNDNHTEDSVISFVSNIINKHSDSYILEHSCNATPFLSKRHDFFETFKAVILEETGIMPTESTSGGTSDARFIQNYCCVVEFGLLSEYAHKIDEQVKILDLQRLYNVYYGALCKMLKS